MQTNATTANIVGIRSLFFNSSFCPKLFLYLFIGPLTFFPQIIVYLTHPRGKSFPREGQSAVPPRGLTIFWCIHSRFSIFCLNVSCFLKLYCSTQLDTPCLQQSRKKKTRYDCLFVEKNITRSVRRRFHEANIVGVPCKRAQHCCATLRRSQDNRNVGTCWAKSLTGFKLYATSVNFC